MTTRFSLITAALTAAVLIPDAIAAEAAPVPEDETLTLPAFVVHTNKDDGYIATNAISGTRLNTPLQVLPKPVDVITSAFFEDIGAIEYVEALRYTSGAAANGGSGVSPEDTTGANVAIRGFNTFTTYRNGFRNFGVIESKSSKGHRPYSPAPSSPAAR
jgi:outer membrane receptor protein involved in Fe transport